MNQRDPFDNGLNERLKLRNRPVAKVKRAVKEERPALFDVMTRAVLVWLTVLTLGLCVQKVATADPQQVLAHMAPPGTAMAGTAVAGAAAAGTATAGVPGN